jgi:2-methylisocitrate lyase-like PEP mutase family enzyme
MDSLPRPPFLRAAAGSPGRRLGDALAAPGVTLAPGAADPLTARLIEEAGFSVVYATGAGIANAQLGVPDVGLVSMDEALRVVRAMAAVVSLPILADADTGFGNPLNVMRTVREFERAGVAGIQLEDQVTPKRCGHFEGKEVVAAEEMVAKIRAARFARTDPDLQIVARTDAAATHGLDEALRRARAYAEAGADAIFVEAPRSVDDLARVTREVPGIPHLANMVEGGKTPILPAATLSELGFSLALYANFPLRAAMHAVRRGLEHLRATGSSLGFEDRIVTMAERQAAVGLGQVEALERHFLED